VALVGPDGTELQARWGDGDVTPEFLEAFRFPLGEKGILASTVAGSGPVNVFDVGLPFFARLLGEREGALLDVPSFAAFPLRRGGATVGVLYGDRNEHDEPFSDAEAETLGSLADLLSLALARPGEPAGT
jgi:GAF domain-containing protein